MCFLRLAISVLGGLCGLLLFLMNECDRRNQIPPDSMMVDNFMEHEAEFNEIARLAHKLEDGNHYPPFNRGVPYEEEDNRCDKWLSKEERDRLDSLLNVVGCERIYYLDRESYRGEPSDSCLSLTYWARGLSIGGTWKEYRYRPRWIPVGPDGKEKLFEGEETSRLMEENGWNDTIVYKRIKGEWYIEFGHDN